MPKRPLVATGLTIAALALLLSFKTPQVVTVGANSQIGGTQNGAYTQNAAGATPGATPGTRSTYSGQLTGTAVQTPYGVVQVQVTFQNGTITDVTPLQLPNDGSRSAQIAQYAAPQLRSEVLSAQSAQVDTISGATYTSEGYLQSLQSALDQLPA
jgi:uncharacterized protein with FMN-binding domain